jgi:two-component system, response regulator PdtaR
MVTEQRPETAEPKPTIEQRFRVLIADDDRGNRDALSELLKAKGFDVVQASDGSEAVEIVQVNMIHLVLFDMHMPRLTGLEALNVLRQTLHKVLPAVLMTADATTELMRQAFLAQVFSVIPKPVNKNIVLHTLTQALAKVYGKPHDPAAASPTTEPTAKPTTNPESK